MRQYEMMVIFDPTLDERTIAPSLDTLLNVVREEGGKVDKVDVWGKRRLAYEIKKNSEGIYAVVDLNCEPATVQELDRLLTLNESVLRTKVLRADQ
ncbi:30S ribosomal protein S6 [Lawsonella clevelandensis]|uniref:Small ribosomal subunit protein bS6 n=1 Tax=Lawsonella clevelandensis TaxID=1528099 RepID=A0A0M4M0H0_9ACTN|nr:30S ribosomal protein S6 [Lawsonella clevelandensis]ALE19669.1 30S ribosomal protein S6 [Lawsonella clevelandensis]ALE34750.1 30S ribosomal protein S6 [Lawsonella clevelandensis]MDU7192907.1 30S ribosomal protein S6 [Lawsonella clevelandensis]